MNVAVVFLKQTSTIVMRASFENLITSMVFSQHRLNTPSTPVSPIPSTRSRDSRNGTVSGVGSNLPCSNATPEGGKSLSFNYNYNTSEVLLAGVLRQHSFHSKCKVQWLRILARPLSAVQNDFLSGTLSPR